MVFAQTQDDYFPPELIEYRDNLKSNLRETGINKCQEALIPLYDIETVNFFKFLEKHFLSKSANSSLTNIALSAYIQYKRNLNNYLGAITPKVAYEEGEKTKIAQLFIDRAC